MAQERSIYFQKKVGLNSECFPVREFSLFGVIPAADRSHVTTYSAVDITLLITLIITLLITLTHRYNIREAELKYVSVFSIFYMAYWCVDGNYLFRLSSGI